jgi:hypothetical protein
MSMPISMMLLYVRRGFSEHTGAFGLSVGTSKNFTINRIRTEIMLNETNSNNNHLVGIYNLGDFLALPLERPKPAIAGFLFEGQTGMLAGRFAVGKTIIATQAAIHLVCGKPFLGRDIPRPYKVGFVDCENGPAEIQGRLKAQINALQLSREESALVEQNCFYVNARDVGTSLYGFQFQEGQTARLEQCLNDCSIEIVIVDNLGRVLSGDLEDTKDVTKFFSTVQEIRDRCPSVKIFLFLHHIKKPSDHNSSCSLFSAPYEYLSQMRGSGRLLDFSESRLALAEEKFGDDTHYVLNGLTRSAEVIPLVLEKNDDALSFQLVTDKNLLFESLFSGRARGKELFETVRRELGFRPFRFGDVENLRGKDGKTFAKGTIASTLKLASANGLLKWKDMMYIFPEILN